MSMFDCAHCGDRHHVNDFCATGPMSAEPAPTIRETADCICVTRGTGPEGCGLCNETGKLQKMQTGPDHIGELSDVESSSRQELGIVREISESAIAVGAEQTANSVCLVTVIDVEIRPPSSGSVLTAQAAHAALIGKHLVVIRYPDTAILSELGFSGLAADPPSQDGVAETLGVLTVPAISCRSTLTASVPSGLMSTLLEIETLDGKGLAALVANRCFHEAINEMICRNDQVTTMIDHAELARRLRVSWPDRGWVASNKIKELLGEAREAANALENLLSEIAALRGERDRVAGESIWWKGVIGDVSHQPSGEVPSIKHMHPAMVKPIYDAHKGTAVADVIAGLIFSLAITQNREQFLVKHANDRAAQAERQRDELRKALEDHDQTAAECRIDGARPQRDTTAPCELCGATQRESCGRKGSAAYAFISSARTLLANQRADQ